MQRRRWLVPVAVLGVGVAACDADEHAAGPNPGAAPVLQTVSQPPFSTTLGITDPYDPSNSVPLSNYPSLTLARLTIRGLTSATCRYDDCGIADATLDARGRWSDGVWQHCYEGVQVEFLAPDWNSGSLVPECPHVPYTAQDPVTRVVVVRGQGTARWTGKRPGCDPQFDPCWQYAGDKTITIEPVTVEFTVTASPATVDYNETVSVTATVTPWQVEGVDVPWVIDSVTWAPAFGTQSSPCLWGHFVPTSGGSPTRTCQRPFTRSGTLTVFATVNGVPVQEAVSITVNPPELHVTATPASLAGPDSVTFTASVTPSNITWNVWSWTWRPDSGTGGISANCLWTEKTCTRVCSKSGWMKATTTIYGEYSLADSAHVSVVPCLLGDSLLDDSRIRRQLGLAWAGSNVNAAPDQRIERFGGRFLRGDGTVIDTTFLPLPGATPCRSYDPDQWSVSQVSSLGTPIAIWHTHPFEPGPVTSDTLPDNCPRGPKMPRNVPRGAFAGPSGDDMNGGGPQIVVDKTNAYHIPDFGEPFVTKPRSSCDILAYY